MLIKTDQDAIRSYFEDSSNLKGGHAERAAFPEDINALSELIKEANEKHIPVTASGGGTGTTGARIPFGGIAVSLEKMGSILEVSEKGSFARVEAGVLVEDLKNECERKGLFYPCHPTERGAFLGGTVATNASGARSFKYGPTRRYVQRLKMVLANGEIFEIRRGEKFITKNGPIPIPSYKIPQVKNSAGYYAGEGTDLIDLFIGQEGTLSVITEIDLALVRSPASILSAFVFFKKDADALTFAAEARTVGALSIEYLDENALRLLRAKNSNVPADAKASIFFEQEISPDNEDSISNMWLKLISKHHANPDNTWVAMTDDEAEAFNKLRHSIPESVNEMVRKSGFRKFSNDIAVPEKNFMKMMNFYKDTLKSEKIGHVIFGHIGECHLHVNLLPKNEDEMKRSEEIYVEFMKKSVSLGGTISAEHGIGKVRRKYLEIMYGRQGVLEMARIKKAFDPNWILGLDNIFPKEVLKEV